MKKQSWSTRHPVVASAVIVVLSVAAWAYVPELRPLVYLLWIVGFILAGKYTHQVCPHRVEISIGLGLVAFGLTFAAVDVAVRVGVILCGMGVASAAYGAALQVLQNPRPYQNTKREVVR